jgi:hypothetical protein
MPEAEITDSEIPEESIKALQGAFGELSEEYPGVAQMPGEEVDDMLAAWRCELHKTLDLAEKGGYNWRSVRR